MVNGALAPNFIRKHVTRIANFDGERERVREGERERSQLRWIYDFPRMHTNEHEW